MSDAAISGTILERIVERKREEIQAGQQRYSLGELEAMAGNQGKARGFAKWPPQKSRDAKVLQSSASVVVSFAGAEHLTLVQYEFLRSI